MILPLKDSWGRYGKDIKETIFQDFNRKKWGGILCRGWFKRVSMERGETVINGRVRGYVSHSE
ncbi:hypothetical protein [Desulfoluna sp.]|uniref:hypothetical protein n=1 Tax=Desulfoluna sp. TaxID=2045199 RepID=UPI002629872E|nr:hypothetical protein [Desulfoluna sp.]